MLCFRRTLGTLLLGAATVGLGVTASVAIAQVAVSANDNKLVLVNGVATVQQNPAPDTVAIIDLKEFPPKIVAEIEAPVSVVGPPLSVAITPDEGLALVTAAMKINPQDPTKQVPDNRLSVIDLKAAPPAVIATLAKYDMVPNYKNTEDYKKFVVEVTESERKVIDMLGLAKKTN